jgi:hypothetical protein
MKYEKPNFSGQIWETFKDDKVLLILEGLGSNSFALS